MMTTPILLSLSARHSTVRFILFARGIHIRWSKKWEQSGIHLCNDGPFAPFILFAATGYSHLIVTNNEFFNEEWRRPLLFLMGIIPEEHGITPESFDQWDPRVSPYLDHQFGVWQPVYMQYRDIRPISYALLCALKRQQTLTLWKLQGLANCESATWLNRRVVTIEPMQQVAIGRRMPVTIAMVNELLNQTYGKPESVVTKRATRLASSR